MRASSRATWARASRLMAPRRSRPPTLNRGSDAATTLSATLIVSSPPAPRRSAGTKAHAEPDRPPRIGRRKRHAADAHPAAAFDQAEQGFAEPVLARIGQAADAEDLARRDAEADPGQSRRGKVFDAEQPTARFPAARPTCANHGVAAPRSRPTMARIRRSSVMPELSMVSIRRPSRITRDPVGDAEHLAQMVGDVDDGDAVGAAAAGPVEQPLALALRQRRIRLVEHQHARALADRAGRSRRAASRRSTAATSRASGSSRVDAQPGKRGARLAPHQSRARHERASRWAAMSAIMMFSATLTGSGRATAPGRPPRCRPPGWRAARRRRPAGRRCGLRRHPDASSPASMFIRVDLPAPFSPTTACTSPARKPTDTRSSASTPGNRLERSRISISEERSARSAIPKGPSRGARLPGATARAAYFLATSPMFSLV